ncbi:MAG TPA: hypothetical protein VFZ22_16825 [Pyrinomonadaceae bacterium]|nr:hypothetical protein [Pyrinomonadaceae bacterium]
MSFSIAHFSFAIDEMVGGHFASNEKQAMENDKWKMGRLSCALVSWRERLFSSAIDEMVGGPLALNEK